MSLSKPWSEVWSDLNVAEGKSWTYEWPRGSPCWDPSRTSGVWGCAVTRGGDRGGDTGLPAGPQVNGGPGMPSGARPSLGCSGTGRAGQAWPRHLRLLRYGQGLGISVPSVPGLRFLLRFPAGSGDAWLACPWGHCWGCWGARRMLRYQEDAEVLAPPTWLFKALMCLSRRERNVF